MLSLLGYLIDGYSGEGGECKIDGKRNCSEESGKDEMFQESDELKETCWRDQILNAQEYYKRSCLYLF